MNKAVIVIIVILLLGGGLYLATNKSAAKQVPAQNVQATPSATQIVRPTGQYPRPSGSPGRGRFGNMPQGSTPIFGSVATISGNQLTIQRQGRNGAAGTTLTIDLTSTTQYAGGAQTDIQTGTRIGGYGTKNTDGSINAEQITINPTIPTRGQNPGQVTGQ